MVLLRKKITDYIVDMSSAQKEGVNMREIYSLVFKRFGIRRETFNDMIRDLIYAGLLDRKTHDEWGVLKVHIAGEAKTENV